MDVMCRVASSPDEKLSQTVEWSTMMLRKLMNDESGVILSAELILVLTLAVLAMVVGLSEVAIAINTELNDLSNAFGALNQSYAFSGFHKILPKWTSSVAGSTFIDFIDDCDFNSSCDLVCGSSGNLIGGGGGAWGNFGG
jgi:Flp pilus assembly pilin Flp